MVFVYKVMGNQFLKRTYTIVDIGFYTLNTFTNLLIVAPGTDNVKLQRVFCAFAVLLFLTKTFYYLKLVDEISPIIDIIIKIVIDIRWFMFIFMLSICAFSTSFFLLGQN